VGDNASGKTALLNAITLPLLGRASDLGARDEGKSAQLLRWLVPTGEKRAISRIEFSDGSVASWELSIKGASASISHTPPPFTVSDPFSPALSVLKSGKENVIRYFVEHFGPEERAGCEAPWFENILKQEEEAASMARAHKATMNAITKTVEQLGYNLDRSPEVIELRDIFGRTKAMHEHSETRAEDHMKSMESWFLSHRPQIEAYLRDELLCQDVGIQVEKSQIMVGIRDYKETGTETLPLTSGAQTIMVALKLASHARMRGQNFSLAIVPDRDYDEKTKQKMMAFGILSPLTMIMQMTREPTKTPKEWEVVRV
jgi:hypothetical protein